TVAVHGDLPARHRKAVHGRRFSLLARGLRIIREGSHHWRVRGRNRIPGAQYLPPHEDANSEFPYQLITGRTIYHFHTRTKTGRAPQLNSAAPDVWVE